MADKHQMSWERDTTQWVDDNNWVHTEPTGSTLVSCSCGFSKIVADGDVQRTIEEHRANETAA